MNIDEEKIEEAITDKTKAIAVVHYAGISPDMDKVMKIAKEHNLKVVEDAAQGFMAKYKGQIPWNNWRLLVVIVSMKQKIIVWAKVEQ